jgi:heme-degrading monooxygenase HmoA
MFVEHLHHRVRPAQAAAFAAHNRRWREALARQPGFLGQMVLERENDPTAWLVIVRWRDRAAMEGFPKEVQAALDEAGRDLSALERTEFFLEDES